MFSDEEIGLAPAVVPSGLSDADIGLAVPAQAGLSDGDIGLPQTRSRLDQVPPMPPAETTGGVFARDAGNSILQGVGSGLGSLLKGVLAMGPPAAKPVSVGGVTVHGGTTNAPNAWDVTQQHPLYQAGQQLEEQVGQIEPPADSTLNKALQAAGGFVPIIATGAAAPIAMGLQTAGDTLDTQYAKLKKQGMSDEDAMAGTIKAATLTGATQSAIWAALPVPLKGLLGKMTGFASEDAITRFVAGRLAAVGEGAALGGAAKVAQNVTTGQPVSEGVGEAAAGLATLQGVLPWHGGPEKPGVQKSGLTQEDIPGATPKDFDEVQGVVPVERRLPAPKPETRFVGGDGASPVVDVTTLSPKELIEYQRLANANKTLQERQLADITAKTRTPQDVRILGEQPQRPGVINPNETSGPAAPLVGVEQPGASQRDLQGGQVSFSAEAVAKGIPNAQQSAINLRPEEQAHVDRVLAEERAKGNFINYRPPQPAPTAREYQRTQERANVEKGLTTEQPPMEPLPQETGQYPTGSEPKGVLSHLQRDRLRVALEQNKPISFIQNILRTKETAKESGVKVGEQTFQTPPTAAVGKEQNATAGDQTGVENGLPNETQLPGVRGAGEQPRQGKDVPSSFSPSATEGGRDQSATEVTPRREPPTGAVGDKDSFPPRPPASGVGGQSSAGPKFKPSEEFKRRETDKRGGFVLEAPEVVRDPKVMGFPASVRPDPTQFHNRLKNMAATGKLSPAELDVYEKAGLGEFLKTKPTVEETAKWMEENGPRVETKVLKSGETRASSVEAERAQLRHKFETWRIDPDDLTSEQYEGFTKEQQDAIDRWKDTDQVQYDERGFDPDTYRSVAPKDKDQTVVMVRVPTVKYGLTQEQLDSGLKTTQMQVLHEGNHFGSEDRNVLGWARVQYHDAAELKAMPGEEGKKWQRILKDVPDGAKVANGVEMQSDWGQKVREQKKEHGGNIDDERAWGVPATPDHPLLKDYNRLILKAAMEQARKDGATHFVVPDAETAMMSEGHDLGAEYEPGTHIIEGLKGYEAESYNGHKIKFTGEATYEGGWHLKTEGGTEFTLGDVDSEYYKDIEDKIDAANIPVNPPQAKGMTLNYSKILPDIMEKLTGSKGEKVSFGEHQRAMERNVRAGGLVDEPRKNLIFRNPDGTPKTDASGLLYPLPESKEPFTLFRQSYNSPKAAVTEAQTGSRKMFSAATGEDFAGVVKHEPRLGPIVKQLGLRDGMKAHELVGNIASQPEVFGKTRSALAQFLVDNFEHVLRGANVEAGPSPVSLMFGGDRTAAYVHAPHSIFLDMLNRDSIDSVDVALHEAAHAATAWQYENPKTAVQHAAVKELKGLLEQAKAGLPEHVQKFLNDVYGPEMAKRKMGQSIDLDALEQKALDAGVSLPRWGETLYGLTNHGEFLAQMFSDSGFRHFLDGVQAKGKSVFARGWDAVKDLLGFKRDSILDKAFDNMAEVGAEREWGDRSSQGLAGIDVMQDLASPKATLNAAKGWSAPAHMAANEDVGNKLVDYAGARIAAPAEAKWLATQVLGDKWKDTAFDLRLGKTLVEERLRALRAQHVAAGQHALAATVNSVMNNADFRKAMADPEIRAAIDRHIATVQDIAQKAHAEVGGKMAGVGLDTGAFVNLKALPQPDMVYGSRKGDITNPLQRRSVFGKEAKGTAGAYELSYRKMAERMVQGNYEQAALHKLYKSYVASGLGVEQRPGLPAPLIGGKPSVKLPIEIRGTPWGATKQKNLWVREDLAGELRQAVQTDSRVQREGLKRFLDIVTTLQIAGPTDAAWHTVNMLANVAGKQGGAGVLGDAIRLQHPVKIIDTLGRVGFHLVRSIMDTPDFQREVAEIAKVGGLRGESAHGGPLGKLSNLIINKVDKAGRVTLNRMYDELVNRGWAKDTDLDRREFINKMGQYNERLLGRFKSSAREFGLSPFVVAGTTMNRNAVERLMLSPGVRAANTEAWLKLRAMSALSLIGSAVAFPIVMNSIITGKPFGRPGTPPGQIDRGTDDENGKHNTFDPLQLDLTRRGLRITGADALSRGIAEGKGAKETAQSMVGDVAQGLLHPWAGPGVRGLVTAATGKDTSGYLVSRNPKNMTDNIIAALKNVNPTVAALFKEREAGKTGLASFVKPLEGAVGFKTGRSPSLVERENEGAQKMFGKDWEKLSVPERVKLQKSLDAQPKGEVNELAKRAGAERALWKGFQRQDDVKAALAPEAKAFLDKHGLELPAFEPEFTIAKTRVPLSRKDEEAEQAAVVTEYNKRIAALAVNPNLGRWTKPQLQQRLDTILTVAKRRARAEVKRGMNSAAVENP